MNKERKKGSEYIVSHAHTHAVLHRAPLFAYFLAGFKYRVLTLSQDQQGPLTTDFDLLVPLGTEIKYTSSCKYDSQSTEISSETDYQKSLAIEASDSYDAKADLLLHHVVP